MLCILISVLESETSYFSKLQELVISQMDSSDRLLVLANGWAPDSHCLETAALQINFLYSNEVLGVASARRMLIQEALRGDHEIILQLDSDVAIPTSFIQTVKHEVESLRPFGILGATALDNTKMEPEVIEQILSESVPSNLLANSMHLFAGRFENMGSSPDYDASYFPSNWYRRFFRSNAFRIQPGDQWEYRAGRARKAGAIPGFCQIWTRQALEAVGVPDANFDPFGYEDVDMSIRSLRAGFRNLISRRVVILHRTDENSRDRSRRSTDPRHVAAMEKGRLLLAIRHSKRPFFLEIIPMIVVALASFASHPRLALAKLSGIREALSVNLKGDRGQN